MTAVAGFAQVSPPQDYLSPELKVYLKLDASQSSKINGLIDDFYAFSEEKATEYLNLSDTIDALRKNATLEPQAIGLAVVDPVAAQIVIERKLDAKLIETEKAVQASLNAEQKVLAGQLSAALKLQPLVTDAIGAFVLSESDMPRPLLTAPSSLVQLHSVFQAKVAAARKQRAAKPWDARGRIPPSVP